MPVLCKHLRTKKMFLPREQEQVTGGAIHQEPDSQHYWCNRTLTEVGVDDQPVHRDCCRSGRRCFEE